MAFPSGGGRGHVLSRSEIERMKSSVAPPQITDTEARRRHLKKLSDERVKHWPNTLEATRRKKENWKKEKMDKEEAELQKRLRIEAIKRANTILYEQTDKMKNLRSQQMYSDVVADRLEQAEEKKIMASWQEERDEQYYVTMQQQLKEAEERETIEKEVREKKAKEIAALQQDQLQQYREAYLLRMKQEKREGEMIAARAEAQIQEDAEAAAERTLKARMAAEEMQLANQELKKLRLQVALQEEEAENKRKADLKRMDDLSAARKAMEQRRFREKQAVQQRMIDKAVEQLAQMKNTEDAILEKQVAEARAKEDNEMAIRAEKRARQRDAIDRSRDLQKQLDEERKQMEIEEAQKLAAHYKVKAKEMEAEEAAEEA